MSYIGNQPLYAAFPSDNFSGNGSTTAYTMSVAPANTASVIVAISGVLQDPSTYSIVGTTLNFSAAPPTGASNISVRYLGIPASGVTTTAYYARNSYTATAGQTSFTIPSYTVGFVQVYRNGVLLDTSDYTATTGTTVVLNSGATSGDTVSFISFLISSVLNAIPSTAGSVGSTNLAANLSLVTPSVTTTLGVGGATPANTGSGITFPATQSASTDANTLDDYEEGSWTPTISYTSSDGNLSYSTQVGRYTKVGNIVTITGQVTFSETTASGSVRIASLPFTSVNVSNYRSSSGVYFDNMAGITNAGYGRISENSTLFLMTYADSGGQSGLTATQTGAGANIQFSITYQTA